MEQTKKKFSDIPVVDRKIIEGVPWAEKMYSTLEGGLYKTFLYWCQIVLTMGESEEVLNNWVSIFMETYEDTCCDLVCDMEYIHGKLVGKIEQLLQKLQQSCKTLKIQMPCCGNKQLSLCQERQQLEKKIEEYEKLIKVRVDELNKLRKKQASLCSSLGQEPRTLEDSPLPSAEEIEEFQRHIEKMESEKFNRLEIFISTKEELLEIIKELNVQPSLNFEKEVFSSDDSAFKVTDENMKKLEQLQMSLHKRLKDVKEEIENLRSKIDELWNLLDVDLMEREAFRQKYTGNSIEVVEALRAELKRCHELKKANIEEFINKLRHEIEELWIKCHCSDAMKNEFGFFYSDCFNEDLLELHEVEKKKWDQYYAENKELLSLLEKHKYLWNKMLDLEESTLGPERYNNRGGKLLKEEKERNKLSKQIPQIEETLNRLAEMYELRCGHPFLTFAETVQEYIINLHQDRENMKKQKLSARKMMKEQTMLTPAKSAISLFPSTSQLTTATPLKSAKRKLATPITTEKKPRMVRGETNSAKVRRTPLTVPAIKVTSVSGMSKRRSVERRKRIQKIRRQSAQKSRSRHDDTYLTDYVDFQMALSNRDDGRSTILPTEVHSTATPTSTRYLGSRIPSSSTRPNTPKPHGGTTPKNRGLSYKTTDANKLSTAKSPLKLIF